jgi:hypothetical protein
MKSTKSSIATRCYHVSTSLRNDTATDSTTTTSSSDPPPASSPKKLSARQSRRAAALTYSSGLSFDQLPYQCFQEALKVIRADQVEKQKQIDMQRNRIERLKATEASASGRDLQMSNRITSMQRRLDELNILAEINDPFVKKQFEDGLGMWKARESSDLQY